MKCRDIIEKLNELAPEAIACGWDNPGLLAGRFEKEVERIYVALDATDQVIKEAENSRADMLITHHPLIFHALKQINDGDFIGRRIIRLIQADIACYAMHTNFDSAPGCMADLAAERIGLTGAKVLEQEGEWEGRVYGIGKVGCLEHPMTLNELAEQVKRKFSLPFVRVYGDLKSKEKLSLCAVSPGSGRSMISSARSADAQVLITGDIGHHEGIDSTAEGMAVIDAGHYGLEHLFVEFIDGYLREKLNGKVQIIKAPVIFPSAVL